MRHNQKNIKCTVIHVLTNEHRSSTSVLPWRDSLLKSCETSVQIDEDRVLRVRTAPGCKSDFWAC